MPRIARLIVASGLVKTGKSQSEIAELTGLSPIVLRNITSERLSIESLLGASKDSIEPGALASTAGMIGNLILGRAAERQFEDMYRTEVGTTEFQLLDQRGSRSDTDYRVHNGSGRPVFRINIKFSGSQFRRALELVKLEADDCFALATYKIRGALKKQEDEHLPYLFVVVSVPGLSAAAVGKLVDDDLIEAATLYSKSKKAVRKRDFEDGLVHHLVTSSAKAYQHALGKIGSGNWYVLSARRAEALLRDKLFERVYALTIRGFTRQFRNAEVDMHFSVSQDLTPLGVFFQRLRNDGPTMVAGMLERGTM